MSPVAAARRRISASVAFARRLPVVDMALLAIVPAMLFGLFMLPLATVRPLIFSYTEPTIVSAYASHFVHLSQTHLLVNLVGYLLLAPVGYVLATLSDRRKDFLTAFANLHLSVPLALSGLNLLFVRPRVTFGYSGLVMGLLALLGLELFEYAQARVAPTLDRENAVVLFGFEMVLITAALVPGIPILRFVAAAVALITLGYAVRIGLDARGDSATVHPTATEPGYLELSVVAVVLLVAFPFVAFPAQPTSDGAILNLYTHLLGFCLPFIVGYVTRLVFRTIRLRSA